MELLACGYQRVRGDRAIHWENARRPVLYSGGYMILQCSLDGAGWFRDRRGTHRLTPGRAFLVAVPSPTAYGLAGGERWEWVWIGFRGAQAAGLVEAIVRSAGHVLDLSARETDADAGGVPALLCDLYDRATGDPPPSSWALSAALYDLLMRLAERFAPVGSSPTCPVPIRRALELIERRFDDPTLGLDALSASAGLSKYHFARRFRDVVGQTPGAYLRARRLVHARDLLSFTDLPVKQVANQSGFTSSTYFCAAFRARFGRSPGSLRARP
jgi:AraC-like DNA-binding protein